MKELKNIEVVNRYSTGSSYCVGEEETETIKFVELEDVVKAFTKMINAFDKERKGNWSRWNFNHDLSWCVHTQSLDYESNLEVIEHYLKEDGEYSCSGGLPNRYNISIKQVGSHYEMTTTTYVHMTISSDLIDWLSEDAIKDALIKKFDYIQEHKK